MIWQNNPSDGRLGAPADAHVEPRQAYFRSLRRIHLERPSSWRVANDSRASNLTSLATKYGVAAIVGYDARPGLPKPQQGNRDLPELFTFVNIPFAFAKALTYHSAGLMLLEEQPQSWLLGW